MKRSFLVLLLVCIVKLSAHAQLKIDNSGNVAVKSTSSPIYSNFAVNSQGSSTVACYVYSNEPSVNRAMAIVKRGEPDLIAPNNYSSMGLNIDLSAPECPHKIYGLYSHVYRTEGDVNRGRSYGVYSYAGNSTSGYNYGVLGTLLGGNYGAGIYGSSVSGDAGTYVPGRYAGYFNGNVKVTGTFQASEFVFPSDIRLKERVEPVKKSCIDDIMKLSVIKYNLKQRYVNTDESDTIKKTSFFEASKEILERKHYGLIAQELKTIYPELVHEGNDGYLSVNYVELIPILIQTIQELNEKVEQLSKESKNTAPRKENVSKKTSIIMESELFQNDPNPFTEETEVRCYIPEEISNADLYIYDMNGRQLEKINISDRGNISLTIKGYSLEAGIYLYSLITDGQVIDTKRMILTK